MFRPVGEVIFVWHCFSLLSYQGRARIPTNWAHTVFMTNKVKSSVLHVKIFQYYFINAKTFWMYLCVYKHTHTYTHTYANTHTHTHTHTFTHTLSATLTQIRHLRLFQLRPFPLHTHIHTHTHIYIHIYTHLCIHTYIYTHICIHTETHTHIYIYIYNFILPAKARGSGV